MTQTKILPQSLRMLRRDWRSGELRLLALALVIAVTAITSVGFFVDRLRQGLQRDAAQYLGGDAVLDSDHPIAAHWDAEALGRGLRTARSLSFPSMAMADAAPAQDATRGSAADAAAGSDGGVGAAGGAGADASVLVAVKAVSPEYPLRGSLSIVDAAAANAPPRAVAGGPQRGTAWVDAQLLGALGIHVGDTLRLGNARLRIAAVLASEPDRATQVMGFAPRLLMSMADLDATGLVQPASRIAFRWMVAGERAPLAAQVASIKPRIERGQHLETLDDGRPEMQRTLNRADRFLGLVALLTALIAAVAVNSASRRFVALRLDTVALLRCLGLTQGQITGLFAGEYLAVGIAASAAGVVAGLGLHLVLLQMLSTLLPESLPAPSGLPALQGLLCGLVLLLGFGMPPLEQLRRVSPVRVLRRDVGEPSARMVLAYGAGAAGFAVLLVWAAGDARLGGIVGAGFVGCIAVFAAVARVLLLGLQRLRRGPERHIGVAWRFALAAMQRRPGATVAQLVALSVGLMALLLLAIVRTDLVDQWRGQAPADAPNRFVINIQPEQGAAVLARLQAAHVEGAALEPMIRGRLVQIDGHAIGPETYDDERARALIDREFNLSYQPDAPAHNTIVQGKWFAPGAAELSIEEGIAQRLHIGLGQRLRFDVAGQPVEATVTSIRKVNWDSMRVNFFVIMDPALLRDAPQSLITAFYLPPAQAALTTALVRAFPNLTVINIDQVLGQVRSMLDQVIAAAQFLFAFALAAGILVLYTALASSQDERMREAALLRALGASRRQLSSAQTAEMFLVGAVAGLLASIGAAAVAWALAHFVFEFSFVPRPWIAIAGIAAGVSASWLGAWSGMRRVLATPPMASLREA
jgi:putative ABC transport system permease protein